MPFLSYGKSAIANRASEQIVLIKKFLRYSKLGDMVSRHNFGIFHGRSE